MHRLTRALLELECSCKTIIILVVHMLQLHVPGTCKIVFQDNLFQLWLINLSVFKLSYDACGKFGEHRRNVRVA